MVYPKGDPTVKETEISVFLRSCNCGLSEQNIFAEYKLRIIDQIRGNHMERIGKSNISIIFLSMLGLERVCVFSMLKMVPELYGQTQGFLHYGCILPGIFYLFCSTVCRICLIFFICSQTLV